MADFSSTKSANGQRKDDRWENEDTGNTAPRDPALYYILPKLIPLTLSRATSINNTKDTLLR